jgi:peptidoglycan hydrolase-like protein with peptidoglycan-binding domain
MKTFKAFGFASLALALALGGCEKRETRTEARTDTTTTPATTPAPTTATTDRVPDTLDRQPVSGTESSVPAGSTASGTTTTTTTTTSDIYYVGDDGNRLMLSDSSLITDMQRKLTDAGVYHGPIDGRTSPELATAIRDYQAKKNMEQTGTIDRSFASDLGLQWDRFTAKADTKMDEAGSDVKRVSGEAGHDLKEGAKDLGRDIKSGAEKAGDKIEAGTKKAGDKIEEGADKAEDKLDPAKKY